MSLSSYLIPQTIARFSSKYNQDIRVIEEAGRPKLLVNGSRQSGKYIEWLWKKAFAAFGPLSASSILVLGVGGGSVIHILRRLYPQALIVGVDIDPQIIEIGKKYFGLSEVPNLELIAADAKDYKITRRYDLVIVDLFIGRNIPDFVLERSFLGRLGPRVIINYLRELEYLDKSEKLKKTLKIVFREVRDFTIARNRFFLALKDPM